MSISVDGVLYVRIVDAFKASYGVENALYAVSQLAQTTMRSELGRIPLDKARRAAAPAPCGAKRLNHTNPPMSTRVRIAFMPHPSCHQ